ncbi:MAG: glycoside hydrolase family 127 protein [Verrucomicrobiales bacterium]|nr:glycoside hydrolase family 127 protein [Verrucomicrobiales bacterium]MCP5527701.1 glycoside hydrolase family 127 protein [Verrucomicrobiales bacterium]
MSGWSRCSGPGEVAFEDAGALSTAATFSAVGEYELALTARQDDLSGTATLQVKVVPAAPERPLQAVETRAYRVDSPLWRDRVKALIVHWIPHCIRQIEDPDLREGGLNNFVEAAKKLTGQPAGEHRGYVFSNAWIFNTLEAICRALDVDADGDKEVIAAQTRMRATLEEWIPLVLAAQEPDGYLQTAFTLSERERWSPRYRGDHEGYVAGYFLDAAVAHHRLTRGADTRLFAAARRLADCWDEHLGPAPKQDWFDGHQAMEMGLMNLGRLVNEVEGPGAGDRYLRLAKFLLDCRRDGSEYDQSHRPVVQQYEAVGHAVRAVYTYTAMADVVLETGDPDYQSAVESLWDNIVNRKYYVTGGVGSGETSEGFGPDYSLRHSGYCESCSSCGEIFFQHRLNLIHHDARYADLLEETLYNALLGSVDLAGGNFYYQNPLDERRPRYPWHGCPCCVGNIPRTLLSLPTWIYAKDPDGVYVNLFVGSTVRLTGVGGAEVEFVQRTDHPWGGRVSLTVNPEVPARFALHVRVPSRSVSQLYRAEPVADGLRGVTVNGAAIEPGIVAGYAVITREWQAGDRVEFTLPMPVQIVRGDARIEATKGQVALRYGPLVYCVEPMDQATTFGAVDLATGLTPEWRADLLGGVNVLRGRWQDGTLLTAIPYYARFNRLPPAASTEGGRPDGEQRATVWLPAP